jgi:3-dehydroquinate synthase
MEIVKVKTEGKTYEIIIEYGLFSKLPAILKEKYSGKKLAVVSDSTVFPLYGESLVRDLRYHGLEVVPIIFEAGEEQKNLATLTNIYSRLADNSFTRSDAVIALGGGVTGDMAGLAAATFLRGMGFVQVPTTLLSMVDSSIGGKVAVDLPQGKNLVGTFYQPDAVFTDPLLLDTLPDRQFSDGMAELLKHGYIRDAALYESLTGFCEYPRKALAGKLDRIICRSCQIKRDIVEEDERDNAIRQLLNFGHTIGHAIERIQNFSGYSHGEAISIGMVAITRLTEKMGLTRKGEAERLIQSLSQFNLPTKMPDLNISDLLAAIRLDKKTRSGKITLAYIKEIGQGKLVVLDLKELEEMLRED